MYGGGSNMQINPSGHMNAQQARYMMDPHNNQQQQQQQQVLTNKINLNPMENNNMMGPGAPNKMNPQLMMSSKLQQQPPQQSQMTNNQMPNNFSSFNSQQAQPQQPMAPVMNSMAMNSHNPSMNGYGPPPPQSHPQMYMNNASPNMNGLNHPGNTPNMLVANNSMMYPPAADQNDYYNDVSMQR